MRYFIELSYKGTNYNGYQRQPSDPSIQQTIEEALSLILRTPISIVGCGRTDTGVHAQQYFIHFDSKEPLSATLLNRLNKYLPTDIALHRIFEVEAEQHARFDAFYRAYEYHIVFSKNPFQKETAYHFPFSKQLDFKKLNEAASLLLEYQEFFPFCKSKTDVKTMICEMHQSEWTVTEGEGMVYHIAANRFLRGMVRLTVGMCLNVGLGKVTVEEVRHALDTQTRIEKSLSAPPEGLFLTEIRYPFL